MTPKERLLKITSYEEYLRERENLSELKPDKEVLEHMRTFFPKAYGGKEELYKEKRKN